MEKSRTSLFVQVDTREALAYLTCVGVTGDITITRADERLTYCPAAEMGAFEPDEFIPGEEGGVATELSQPLESVMNWLLELECRAQYRVNVGCAGDRFYLNNYLVGFQLFSGRITAPRVTSMMALEQRDNDRIMTNGTISATQWALVKQLQSARQGMTATQPINDLAFLPAQCETKCSVYRTLDEIGYAVLDTDYLGVYGDTVLRTVDRGVNWTPTATSPFNVVGRNASAVLAFNYGTGHRVIVAGGPSPATYPEIDYSDTQGAIWYHTNPVTGAGTGGLGVNRLCRDKQGRVWAALDNGYICYSRTAGQTWATAEAGVETGEDVNDIVFYDGDVGYAVCDANVVLRTTDGSDWNALVGPAPTKNLLSVQVNRFGHVFVGDNAACVWRSTDQGVTWVLMLNLTAGSIDRIGIDPKYRYYVYPVWNDAVPHGTLYRSEDGGVTYDPVVTPANAGITAIAVNDQNTLFTGGNLTGGTTWLAKFQRRTGS